MSTLPRPLQVIEISGSCPVASAEVSTKEREKFCQYCQRHVYNLSAMTSSEAERLLCEEAGELCVQFDRDPRGRVITLDYAQAERRKLPTWVGRMASILTVTGVFALLGAILLPTRTRGAICRPRPAAATSSPTSTASPAAGDEGDTEDHDATQHDGDVQAD